MYFIIFFWFNVMDNIIDAKFYFYLIFYNWKFEANLNENLNIWISHHLWVCSIGSINISSIVMRSTFKASVGNALNFILELRNQIFRNYHKVFIKDAQSCIFNLGFPVKDVWNTNKIHQRQIYECWCFFSRFSHFFRGAVTVHSRADWSQRTWSPESMLK